MRRFESEEGVSKPTYEELEYGLRLLSLEGYFFSHTITADGHWDSSGKENLVIEINCNDYFEPAADCETVLWPDTKALFEKLSVLSSEDRGDAAMQYIADKRGIENKYWRKK